MPPPSGQTEDTLKLRDAGATKRNRTSLGWDVSEEATSTGEALEIAGFVYYCSLACPSLTNIIPCWTRNLLGPF